GLAEPFEGKCPRGGVRAVPFGEDRVAGGVEDVGLFVGFVGGVDLAVFAVDVYPREGGAGGEVADRFGDRRAIGLVGVDVVFAGDVDVLGGGVDGDVEDDAAGFGDEGAGAVERGVEGVGRGWGHWRRGRRVPDHLFARRVEHVDGAAGVDGEAAGVVGQGGFGGEGGDRRGGAVGRVDADPLDDAGGGGEFGDVEVALGVGGGAAGAR